MGRLIIQSLLERVPAGQVVALVRDPGKVQDLAARGVVVRTADYNQPATLTAALKGVEKLLLISSSEVGSRAAQHRAVIEAAKAVGIALLAYTSVLHADTSSLGLAAEHRDTEAALKASRAPRLAAQRLVHRKLPGERTERRGTQRPARQRWRGPHQLRAPCRLRPSRSGGADH